MEQLQSPAIRQEHLEPFAWMTCNCCTSIQQSQSRACASLSALFRQVFLFLQKIQQQFGCHTCRRAISEGEYPRISALKYSSPPDSRARIQTISGRPSQESSILLHFLSASIL